MSDLNETALFTPAEFESCLKVLRALNAAPDAVTDRRSVEELVARLYKSARKQRRKAAERIARREDRQLIEATARVRLESSPVASRHIQSDGIRADSLSKPHRCYICKKDYAALHFFYHQLCPDCAQFNYAKRNARAELSGRRALVTGGRIKIGFQTALKLLRDGAEVHVTTRFPMDAARRYCREHDFEQWSSRLRIYALDLCRLPTVISFAEHLTRSCDALDILINNAAQTIRRPASFYAHLIETESAGESMLPDEVRKLLSNGPENAPHLDDFDPRAALAVPSASMRNGLDRHGQPGDLRWLNSWALKADEVEPVELLETFFVNAIGPYLLNTRLKPLLLRSPHADRFIVNVSAMEGQFARESKTANHPHTNMAKAALNMLTRTSAQDFAQSGIHMNSVDTGWITDENPHPKKTRMRERGFVPPLDEIDGAARIYDPVVRGVGGELFNGLFLKDYAPSAW